MESASLDRDLLKDTDSTSQSAGPHRQHNDSTGQPATALLGNLVTPEIVRTVDQWRQIPRSITSANSQRLDDDCQSPTAHLHQQGQKAEEERDRLWRWQRDLAHAYGEWLPILNTRIDLTLKKGIPLKSWVRAEAAEVLQSIVTAGTTSTQNDLPPQPHEIKYAGVLWVPVDEDVIGRDAVRFLMRLNSYVLKPSRKATYTPRLSALVVLEYGHIGHLAHLHALLERPPSVPEWDFDLAVRKAWRAQSIANREMRIEPIDSLPACLSYNTKSLGGSGRVIYQWHEPDTTAYWRH